MALGTHKGLRGAWPLHSSLQIFKKHDLMLNARPVRHTHTPSTPAPRPRPPRASSSTASVASVLGRRQGRVPPRPRSARERGRPLDLADLVALLPPNHGPGAGQQKHTTSRQHKSPPTLTKHTHTHTYTHTRPHTGERRHGHATATRRNTRPGGRGGRSGKHGRSPAPTTSEAGMYR